MKRGLNIRRPKIEKKKGNRRRGREIGGEVGEVEERWGERWRRGGGEVEERWEERTGAEVD